MGGWLRDRVEYTHHEAVQLDGAGAACAAKDEVNPRHSTSLLHNRSVPTKGGVHRGRWQHHLRGALFTNNVNALPPRLVLRIPAPAHISRPTIKHRPVCSSRITRHFFRERPATMVLDGARMCGAGFSNVCVVLFATEVLILHFIWPLDVFHGILWALLFTINLSFFNYI
jgi:hypothetical protein